MNTESLHHLGLIKISGEDAPDFLQGQLSNDITALNESWQFTGYCNPQGRLIALMYLWRYDQSYLALLHQSLIETVIKRLRMYVLRSKVEITEVPQAKLVGVFSDSDLQPLLEQTGLNARNHKHGTAMANDVASCLQINQRYLMVFNDRLTLDNEGSENNRWLAADIDEGLPQIDRNTSESFVPQMVNLDLLNGVNFKKGCYTGQEIVARMHYLGKLKQRMFLCSIEANGDAVQSGDTIYADEADTKAGTVINVDPIKNRLLAVLRFTHLNASLSLENGKSISVSQQQPYDIKP